MQGATPRSRIPALASGLVASALLGGMLAWGARPERARVRVSPEAAAFDASVADSDIVVLGNSAAKRNVDAELLARRLGASASNLGMPGTFAPTWETLLEDRVFGRGLHPRLVVLADTVSGLLVDRPPSDAGVARRMALSDSRPAELGTRVGGTSAWSRLGARASELRSGLVDGYRDRAAGLLFAARGRGTLADRGRLVADRAADAVLGGGAVASTGFLGAVAPDFEVTDDLTFAAPADSWLPAMIELSRQHGAAVVVVQLPRINGLLDEASLRHRDELVTWLNEQRVPFVDLSREDLPVDLFADPVHMKPEGQRVVTGLIADRLVELGGLEPTFVPASVVPPIGLARTGRPLLPPVDPSSAIRVDACHLRLPLQGPLSPAALGALHVPGTPYRVLLDGEPLAALPPLRYAEEDAPPEGCAGGVHVESDGLLVATREASTDPARLVVEPSPDFPLSVPSFWMERQAAVTPRGTVKADELWVLPGTEVRFTFPAGWSVPGGTRLALSLLAVDPGRSGATLEVEGEPVVLRPDHHVLRAELPVPAVATRPEGALQTWLAGWRTPRAWEAVLRSPDDGPALLVRDLRAELPDGEVYLVGAARTATSAADLLPVGDAPVTLTWAAPPPTVVTTALALRRARATAEWVDGPWLALPEVQAVADISACVPLGVELDGQWLDARPLRRALSVDVPRGTEEAALADAVVRFHPERRCTSFPAESEPGEMGKRTWKRHFSYLRTGRWLYPGDRMRVERTDVADLHAPATVLHATGFGFGGAREVTGHLSWGSGAADVTLPVSEGVVRVDLPLPTALPPDAGAVTLDLSLEEGFVFLTSLSLDERAP